VSKKKRDSEMVKKRKVFEGMSLAGSQERIAIRNSKRQESRSLFILNESDKANIMIYLFLTKDNKF
jgi:hypothetical protein